MSQKIIASSSLTRKHYPKKKRLMYEELQRIPAEYNIVALSKMSKVRAAQLMMIRKKFRNDIKIKIVKNKVAIRAFEKVNGVAGIENLSKQLEGQYQPLQAQLDICTEQSLSSCQRRRHCHKRKFYTLRQHRDHTGPRSIRI